MAVNVYLAFYHRFDAQRLRKMELPYLISCYGIPFLPAFIFFFIKNGDGVRVYGSAVQWCWITPEYDILRIATFYGPIWYVEKPWYLSMALLIDRQGGHYNHSRNLRTIRRHDLSKTSTTSKSPRIRFRLRRPLIRQPKFDKLCQNNRSNHRRRVDTSVRGSPTPELGSSSVCSRPQTHDRPRRHSSKRSCEPTAKQPEAIRATKQRCLQSSMGLYKGRHAFLRRHPYYMDSLKRQQNVLTYPSRSSQQAIIVYECDRPSAPRILERCHLCSHQ